MAVTFRSRRRPNRGPKAITAPLPSPVGGWNARDSKDEMDDDEAIDLINWFPGQGDVVLRKGYVPQSAGLGGAVESLREFNSGTDRKLIGAANGRIWDATGLVPTQLGSSFASNRWQMEQFDDAAGGPRLGMVNGVDSPQAFNGSSLEPMVLSGLNITPNNFNGINVFKSRTYFWDTRQPDFWYSAVNALGGALTRFPLGRVSGTGGNMVAMGTWTKDGGDMGPDDLAVFLLSSGDVVIYAGDNPGNSSAWELVGIFKVGAPMGVRALKKVGADLVVITTDGYVPLSKVLAHERSRPGDALSDKIRKAVLAATRAHKGNFGWEVAHYPNANMALFNVPISATLYEQHAVNTLTGAWCKFRGMNARCWATFNDRLYFGGNGVIYKADEGASDDNGNIVATAQTAWNYLRRPGQHKELVLMRYIFEVDGPLTFSYGAGVDYKPFDMTASNIEYLGAVTPWSSPWDSPWSAEEEVSQDWLGAGGIGLAISSKLEVVTKSRSVKWLATQYQWKPSRGAL